MADNRLSLVNSALRHLGEPAALSLDETAAVRKVDATYDEARREMLRDWQWPFATARAQLTAENIDPVTALEWQYAHALPLNSLRILDLSGDGAFQVGRLYEDEYDIEGGLVLSNDENLYARYIQDVTDTTTFDATFDVVLPLMMASKAALDVSQSGTLRDRMLESLSVARVSAISLSEATRGVVRRRVGRWGASRHG